MRKSMPLPVVMAGETRRPWEARYCTGGDTEALGGKVLHRGRHGRPGRQGTAQGETWRHGGHGRQGTAQGETRRHGGHGRQGTALVQDRGVEASVSVATHEAREGEQMGGGTRGPWQCSRFATTRQPGCPIPG